jgi:hypothetical protein
MAQPVAPASPDVGDRVSRTLSTKRGGRCTAEMRLVWGWVEGLGNGFLFPAPGIHTLRVQFGRVESAPVTIEVDEPAGQEAEVLAAIRDNPFAIVWWAGEDADRLRTRYPGSRYVAGLPRWPSGR